MEKLKYNIIPSRRCNVGLVWVGKRKDPTLIRIFLSARAEDLSKRIKGVFPEAKQGRDKKITFVSGKIRRYLNGQIDLKAEIACFNLPRLRKTLNSKFQRDVSRSTAEIPYGRVTTYKDLAGRIGANSARPVGGALAKNPFPIIVPCHRVVGSRRGISGFQSGKDLKKTLLRLEGIIIDKQGKIPEKFFM